MTPDPEARRWNRKYPTFPGVTTCLELLRQGNVRGSWRDIIYYLLLQHAAATVDELLTAYPDAEDSTKITIISVLAEARLEATLPFLIEQLRSPLEQVRTWAIFGLKNLASKESRRALWDARSYTLHDPAATAAFREELTRVLDG